jgi:hypothetical protein
MALAGTAFLALFNDFAPELDDEYNEWHSREHVPERLGVPGMLRARRYVSREGVRFPYFTLYEMQSSDVMRSQPYLHLLDHPTPWSARMRPSFRQFLRIPCEGLASAGEGIAGHIATYVVEGAGDGADDVWRELCESSSRLSGLTGVHAGRQDPSLRGPSVAAAQTLSAAPTFVLLVESQERRWLAAHRPAIEAGLGRGVMSCCEYDLMHVLRPATQPKISSTGCRCA